MEGYDASTYGERWADIYDDWYDDPAEVADVVGFITVLAGDPAAGGPILELGIGTGRLALGLAAAGYDVRGIDASTAMVERLRAKPGGAAIPVTIGDMAAVVVPPPTAAGDGDDERDLPCQGVFVASNTFFGLSTEAEQRACLARVVEVLEPDGWFVLAAFVPGDSVQTGRGSDVGVRTLDADRVVLTADVYDAATQTMSGQFIDISSAGIVMRPFHIRYLFPTQLDAIAADAGLTLVGRHEDWTGTPFTADSSAHVSVYRRGP